MIEVINICLLILEIMDIAEMMILITKFSQEENPALLLFMKDSKIFIKIVPETSNFLFI